MHVTRPKKISRGMAAALLAGEWDRMSMIGRVATAFGAQPAFLSRLITRILIKFGDAHPRPLFHELAEMIRHDRIFESGWRLLPVIHERYLVYAKMAPVRGAPPAPPIDDLKQLAAFLRMSITDLDWLTAPWRKDHYIRRQLPKRSGGTRLIEAPKLRLKIAQERILHGLLDQLPAHEAAHGFRPGRSIRTNATLHTEQKFVVRLDLTDFFPSIRRSRVFAMFRTFGYAEPVARALTALCTTEQHLPQGAPTSPAIANLCAYRLDLRLTALAAKAGCRYTRYADDLTLSGDRAHRLIDRASAIALEEGFAVNGRKTRVTGRGRSQRVTGVVVNEHPNVPREHFDRLKAILHDAALHGPEKANRERRPQFRSYLAGELGFVESINPSRGAKLRALFAQIRW